MRRILLSILVSISLGALAQGTWSARTGPIGGSIVDLAYHASSGKFFALGTSGYLYVSSDNGASWSRVTFSASYSYYNDVAVIGNTVFVLAWGSLYASADGVTFTRRTVDDNQFNSSSAYRIRGLSAGAMVILGNSNPYYSSNSGVNWTAKPSFANSVNENYLAVNASDQIFILEYNSTNWRPFRSTDGGQSFAEQSTGITGNAWSIVSDNAGAKLYCVSDGDIYSSTNGNSWSSIKGGDISDVTLSDGSFDGSSYIAFTSDGLGMYFVDNYNHKLYSKGVADAPSQWSEVATSFPSSTLTARATSGVDFSSPTSATALFGTPEGIYKTTTGGASIVTSNLGLTEITPRYIVADNNNNVYVYAEGIGILRSTDQGNTWSKINGLPSRVDFFFGTIDKSAMFLRDDNTGKWYRSQNGGGSWPELTTAPGGLYWMGSAADADKMFALGGGSFYYSKDQGDNWSTVAATGLPSSYTTLNSYNFTCASPTIFVFEMFNDDNGFAHEYWKVEFTYDGSDNITSAAASKISEPSIANIYEYGAGSGKIYFYGYGGSNYQIGVSDDGGASWTLNTSPGNDLFDVLPNGYVISGETSGSTSTLFISRDDGVTLNFDLNTFSGSQPDLYRVQDIAVDYYGYGYLAFDQNYVYKSDKIIVAPDAAPTSLAVQGVTSSAVALRWIDNSTNEDHYLIEKSTDGVNYGTAGTIDYYDICENVSPTYGYFVSSGLQENTSYTFRVTAVNDAGSSEPVTITQSTTGACSPGLPANRSWDAVSAGGNGFTAVTIPQVVAIKHLGEGQYTITDASLGVLQQLQPFYPATVPAYFYESCGSSLLNLESGDDLQPNGNGTWDGSSTLTLEWRACEADATETITLTLRADDPAPSTPSNVRALVLSNTETEVSWTSGYYDNNYVIERSLSMSSGFSQVGNVNFPTTSFVDPGPLTTNTTYYYRVKAVNGNSSPLSSPYSSAASVTFKKPNFIVSNTTLSNYVSATINAGWADFDADGLEDFYTVQFDDQLLKGVPILFRNLGTGDFAMVTPTLFDKSYTFFSVQDYDNDGFPDLSIMVDEDVDFDFYKGNGDFTFTSVSGGSLGDAGSIGSRLQFQAWADMNNDGLLDFVIGVTENGNDQIYLYKQNVDHTFSKIPGGDLATDTDEQNGGLWSDYDEDGFQDLLIVNSNGPWRLYKNDGDNTFTKTTGIGLNVTGAFAASWGDYNNDGHMDLYAGVPSQNALYLNNGDGTFTQNVSTSISELSINIAASWGDYNNDGFLDLFTGGFNSTARLFLRDATQPGSLVFTKITGEKINDPGIGHYGIANADYDGNGFLDLGMSNFTFMDPGDHLVGVNGNLFKNNNSTGNWIGFRLVPANGNATAAGARVKVTVGSKIETREIQLSTSFVSRNSSIVHIGLGSATTVGNVEIHWPSGITQNFTAPINMVNVIPEDGQGPMPATLVPADGATNVSTTTILKLTVDEASTAVAGKKLYVYDASNLSTPLDIINVTGAAKSGNQYTFTLSVTLPQGAQIEVAIDGGAFKDNYGNVSAAMATGDWTFTTGTGPAVATLSPTDLATDVNADESLVITFDKNITAVAGKKITVSDGTTNLVNVNVASNGTVNADTYTLNSPSWPRAKNLSVTLDAGAFVAGNGIPSAAILGGSWTFTTSAGPQAQTFSPADGATGVSANAALSITFDRDVTAVAGKKITVKEGSTTLLSVDVSANGSVGAATYTLPSPLWPGGKTLDVTLDAGAFIDANSNQSAAITNGSWSFATNPGPAISSLSPANNATDVSKTASLVITFNKNITAVAGKMITVTDGGTPLVDDDVTNVGSVATNKYTLPSPSGGWANSTTYEVLVQPGAFVDASQNGFAGIASGTWSFTVIEAPDTEAPVFGAFTPPASLDKGFGTASVGISVTDNKQVASVKFKIKKVSAADAGYVNVNATFNAGTSSWEATFNESNHFDAMGTEFYVEATDNATPTANTSQTTVYSIPLKYSSTDARIPASFIGIGGAVTTWKVFSIPFELGTNNSVTTVFDEIATRLNDKKQARLITYKGATTWGEYPSDFTTITRGKSYLINIKDALTGDISVGNNLTAPDNDRSNLFQMNLAQGWNQIGNPYLTTISWSDVATYNTLTGAEADLKKFSNNTYSSNATLAAYDGGFIFMSAATTIEIPFQGQTTPGGRIAADELGENIAGNNWIVPLTITRQGMTNELSGVGMAMRASETFDDYDDITPPRFFDYLEVNFNHPEFFAHKFSRDVVPTASDHVWEFEVETNLVGDATLAWDNTKFGDNDKQLFLFDMETQEIVDMRGRNHFTFNPGISTHFKVYFGTDVSIKPSQVTLGQAYPNPGWGMIKIPFSLPEKDGSYSVSLDVFDNVGRKVATLVNRTMTPDFYTADWDTGETALAGGLYMYRLAVGGPTVREVRFGKLLLTK